MCVFYACFHRLQRPTDVLHVSDLQVWNFLAVLVTSTSVETFNFTNRMRHPFKAAAEVAQRIFNLLKHFSRQREWPQAASVHERAKRPGTGIRMQRSSIWVAVCGFQLNLRMEGLEGLTVSLCQTAQVCNMLSTQPEMAPEAKLLCDKSFEAARMATAMSSAGLAAAT